MHAEQAGAIGGELGLAEPVVERDDQALAEERADAERHLADERHDGGDVLGEHGVEDVRRLDVAELVRQDEEALLVVEHVDEARGHDDERARVAVGESVGVRIERDVELGLLDAEDLAAPLQRAVEARQLARADAHVAGDVVEVVEPLEAVLHDLGDDGVEAGDGAERVGGDDVVGMLEVARAEAGEGDELAPLLVGGVGHETSIPR